MTRCCCPPESSPTWRSARSVIPHRRKRLIHPVAVLLPGPPEPAEVNVTPHHYNLPSGNREAPIHSRALRHDSHPVAALVRRIAVDFNTSAMPRFNTENEVKERRLSRAVRPHEGDPFSRPNGKGDPLEHITLGTGIAEPHVVQASRQGCAAP